MKKNEMKKLLKNCRISMKLNEEYGSLSSTLLIHYTRENCSFEELFLRIDGQASKLADVTAIKAEPNCFRSFPGYTGFYAVKCNAQVCLKYSLSDIYDAKRAEMFFDIIRDTIEASNLDYVAPKCDLTQVIRALELLGSPLYEVTVNNASYQNWRSAQRDQERAS